MAVEVIMPKAGSEMTEGEIVRWFKNEGDMVKEGEVLLEIVTDKVNMEVEAEASGVLLKTLAKEGDIVPVVQTIAWIGEPGEKIPDNTPSEDDEIPEAEAFLSTAKQAGVNLTEKPKKLPKRERKGEYDVCVIGGGPAGYVAAIKAAQLGGKVALVEKDSLGGTCLNRGCIPTKSYMHNAEIIHHIREAASRGIHLFNDSFTVDMKQSVEVKNKTVKTLTGGVGVLLRSNGVKVFNGEGKLTGDNKVMVDGKTLIDADSVILAGGSKVNRIPIQGIDLPGVLTSDDILDLEEVPARLAVIGGGVIGSELGQAFAAFGSKVTIIEMADRLVAGMDREASALLLKRFKKEGIQVLLGAKLLRIEERGRELVLKVEGQEDIVADKVLLSVGRIADLSAIEDVEFEMVRGYVKVNGYMETSVPNVYAPGDINGIKMLAHAAFKMGEIAAENAMGGHRKVDLHSTPSAIYTSPEIAGVGLSEEEARESYDIKVGYFHFSANGRALAANEHEGFVKVIMDTKYHEILGVHIVSGVAAEIINEASTLIQTELTVDDVEDIIHGHPTYSEALYEACLDCLDMSIHSPKKKA